MNKLARLLHHQQENSLIDIENNDYICHTPKFYNEAQILLMSFFIQWAHKICIYIVQKFNIKPNIPIDIYNSYLYRT